MNEHSTYCFASAESKYALFLEAYARGWLAAILDFPRLKTVEQSIAPAMIDAILVKQQVCCIPTEEKYELLFGSGWGVGYADVALLSEREVARLVLPLKSLSTDDALVFIKETFESDGRTNLGNIYARMTL